MNRPVHKKEKPKLNVGFGIGLGEYTASVIAGIASGTFAAGKTIRDKFYDDVKNSTDILGDKVKEHAASLSEITLKIPEGSNAREAFKTFAKDIREKKLGQAKELDELILQHRGVRESLIGGTLDRAALMSPRSVKGIIFNTVIGISIGAAVTLGFFNGIVTRDKIERIDNAVEPELNAIKHETERTTRHVDRLAEAEARHNKKKADAAAVAATR